MNARRALVVVDVQNDFISGSVPVAGGEQVATHLAELIHSPHDYDIIVTTQDWHLDPGTHWSEHPDYKDSWPIHGRAGSWGAQLHPALADSSINEKFYKGQDGDGYTGFEGMTDRGEYLADWLDRHKVRYVDIAGIALDKCVYATARDAASHGFHARVLQHYCAAVSPRGARRTVQNLRTHNIEIVMEKI
jgi:nicotinamidase/pyrazinamidase